MRFETGLKPLSARNLSVRRARDADERKSVRRSREITSKRARLRLPALTRLLAYLAGGRGIKAEARSRRCLPSRHVIEAAPGITRLSDS